MNRSNRGHTDVTAPLSAHDALDLALTHWRLLSTIQRGEDSIEEADDGEADTYRQCKAAQRRLSRPAS